MTDASPPTPPAAADRFRSAWQRHGRVLLTLTDQGLVSIATFATNFLLLNHFRNDVGHYAAYTLAFNLMIWAAEFQATLVFTPHTIRSPRLRGSALRRFHGSTLLQNTAVSLVTAVATLIAAAFAFKTDREMATVLLALGVGTVFIGLRSYARPYCFTARQPMTAVTLDFAVTVLQIAGILALKFTNLLSAASAILVVAAAAALPSIVWLFVRRHHFRPGVAASWHDLRDAWPQTKWVFLSGLTWNAGMLLYPWLIKLLGGDAGVAVWGACYQLACVANPLLMGLQNFIGPRIAEAVTEMPGRVFTRYVYRVAIWTAVAMAGPAVFVAVFADAALSWLTHGAFTGQHAAISFLCAAIVVQAITFTLSRGLFALHRADLDLYCNSLPLITLFTVGIGATYTHGVAGAAASMLIAQLLAASSRAVLFAIAVRKSHAAIEPMPVTPALVEAARMTALTLPTLSLDRERPASTVPWITALVVTCVFAAANWSWDISQRWYASSEGDVAALVDRISEGQARRQLAYLAFAVYGMVLCALPGRGLPRAKLRLMYPVVLFVGWALASITWSVDTAQTAKRLVVFVAMVLNVIGFLKHYDIKQLAQIALIGGGITLLVGLSNETRIWVVDRPDLGKWRFGGMMHPNHAALNAIVVMIASQYLLRLTKQKWLAIAFLVGFGVLFFTRSRTALMAGMTAVAALWVLTSPPRRLGWTLLLATWLAAGVAWLASMEMLPEVKGLISMGRDDVKKQDVSSLTGRTDIWKFAVMQADKDPNRTFIGYGFETFWTPENTRGVSEFVKFKISEGHCVYLDWYLELGLVGVTLYLLILLTALFRWGIAARRLNSPSAAVAAAILCGSIVHGFAESSLGDASIPTLFIYLSLAGSAFVRPDEEELA